MPSAPIQKQRYLGMRLALIYLTCLFVASFLAPLILHQNFDNQQIHQRLLAPSATHLFGTDALGRDLFARTLAGAQISIIVGVASALISLILGLTLGSLAGIYGSWVDFILIQFIDGFYIFPPLFMAMLVTLFMGHNLFAVIVSLSVTSWMGLARLVRGQILLIKEATYFEAAQSLGCSPFRLILKHLLPNLRGPLIVALSFQVPSNILTESFLSFLGLGLQPPLSSWGVLVQQGWKASSSYPYLLLMPGIVIFFSLFSFNVLGDGLRDKYDNNHQSFSNTT